MANLKEMPRRDFLRDVAASGLGLLTAPLLSAGAESARAPATSLDLKRMLERHPDVASVTPYEVESARTVVIHLRQRHANDVTTAFEAAVPGAAAAESKRVATVQGELARVTASLLKSDYLRDVFVEGMNAESLEIYNRDWLAFRRMKEIDSQLSPSLKEISMRDPKEAVAKARASGSPQLALVEELSRIIEKGIGINDEPYTWLAFAKLRQTFQLHDTETPAHSIFMSGLKKRFDDVASLGSKADSESRRLENIIRSGGSVPADAMDKFQREFRGFKRKSEELQSYLQSREFHIEVFEKREDYLIRRIGEFARNAKHTNPIVGLLFGANHELQDDIARWNKSNPEDRLGLLAVSVRSV